MESQPVSLQERKMRLLSEPLFEKGIHLKLVIESWRLGHCIVPIFSSTLEYLILHACLWICW